MADRVLRALMSLTLVTASAAVVAAQGTAPADLKRMSLEELIGVEVSTVSRAPVPTSGIGAAIFVITRNDILRSGAKSLPEILRLAPGISVARIDAARYAIGVRGFADRLSRSMLVLIDGRAVYSPLFAGTYWEVQDTLLLDVERIEIIRGPGGTLWGANAVNGIINIITRNAQATQGALVTATLGVGMRGPVSVRYGGAAGENFHYRLYAKAFDRDAQAPGPNDYDDWRMAQGGFRADWSFTRARSLTLQGDIYAGRLGQRVTQPLFTPPFSALSMRESPLSGGNILARWSGPLGSGEYQVQTYYDRTSRDERPVAEKRDTVDVDFQHRQNLGTRHRIVWGAGYRVTNGRIDAVAPTRFVPDDRTDSLLTAFLQDDVWLIPNRLRAAIGAKMEHNEYSGFEFQPSGRIVWTIGPSNTLFSAVTRAVRTPSRVETDYATTALTDPAVPAFVRLQPNQAFEAEELTAYELGYRVQPHASLYLTTAAFFNHHENILSTELSPAFVETSPGVPRLILPITLANGLHGNSHGVEITGDLRVTPWWRWTAGYSYLRVEMTRNPGSEDVSQERRYEGLSPQHQVQVHASIDLPRNLFFDWLVRHVSELPAGPVPGYATSNVRLSWRATPQFEIEVVGTDLHQARHLEWSEAGVRIGRSAYVNVTLRR